MKWNKLDNKRFAIVLIALFIVLLPCDALPCGALMAQQDDRRSGLGERQRMVERKMAELESQFEIYAEKLSDTEPERAERLVEALQQAKRDLIAVKMAEITSLLDQKKYQQAEAELDLVILKLEQLVRLLLNDKEDKLTRQQEIDKLNEWKEKISQIRDEEANHERETSKVADPEAALEQLGNEIQQVEALIRRQQAVLDETNATDESSPQSLDRIANEQFEVRQQTESLARQLGGQGAAGSPGAGDPAAPGDGETGEPPTGGDQGEQPDEGKQPDEGGQPANEGGDANAANPSEPDVGSPQPGSDSAAGGDPGRAKPGEPGQAELQQAAGHQSRAEQQLAEGQSAEAAAAEAKALEELEAALAALKKEQRRIASLPPEALQEMARQQRKTEQKTSDLERDMAQSPKGGSSEGESSEGGGQSGDPSGQQSQPGQQGVQRAQEAMQNAGDNLRDSEPDRAARQQQRAVEELDNALREIEERLDQLREETREEKLARLESRFREMLARQQVATLTTLDINDKKVYLDRVRRRDVLGMLRLGTEELEIRELGQQAYELLLEDGTSIVFPEMVQVLQEDLERVAQLLESENTGALTQLLQREIEFGLEELLRALEKSRDGQQDGGGGGGGGGGNQPLLQQSAELKMLRSAQLRVNRRTRQFDLIKGADTLELSGDLRSELDKIETQQADIVEMMIRVMEKQQ